MAIKVEASWFNGIISKINNLLSTKSNLKDQLSKIAVGDKVTAQNIATMNDMLTKMKRDKYLSTVSNLFVIYVATQNELIYENFYNNINNMANGWSKIVCKNDASNSNGTNSQGTNSHGVESNGYEHEGTTNSPVNYGSNKAVTNITIKDKTSLRNGTETNGTCSHGVCSKGTTPNVTNVKTTNSNTV